MRILRTLAAILVGAAAVAATAEETADPLLPGLHVTVPKAIVHGGATVRARVAWETGPYCFVAGRFTVRWQLRSLNGPIVACGRRPLRIGGNEEPPYRFSVTARVPRKVNWDVLALEVGLVEDTDWEGEASAEERGEATFSVQPGRAHFLDGEERESWTGTLQGVGTLTSLRWSDEPWNSPLGLAGPGVSAIRANPAWAGATATVTGRRFYGTCCLYYPEDPGSMWVEEVRWLDPLPEDLQVGYYATGVVPARLPPPELLGEVNWVRFARESRTPRAFETAEELEAFAEDLGVGSSAGWDPLRYIADITDFETKRVVVVLAGVSPDPAWGVDIGSVVYDPREGRTLVRYAVIAPWGGFTRGFEWSEPWAALAIERREGPVEFIRDEWIPDPPPWW
ncbi:MAG: hypothetical protein HUU06_02680 [Planctomycetaceae bacterium]|nr:hypothetical protein [Planctomycetaceae bacterium]